MAGNTLGDYFKADQLDLLKQSPSDHRVTSKKPVAPNAHKTISSNSSVSLGSKTIVDDDYLIFHSYVRNIVQKSELYDTMFDFGGEESFATLSEMYDNPVSKDIIDYFACCFFDGEYNYLDSIAIDCEKGIDSTPDDYAVVLGHKVPITYREEYALLSILCSIAVRLDRRFEDDPIEQTVIVYNQTISLEKIAEDPKTIHSSQYPNTLSGGQSKSKDNKKAHTIANTPKKSKRSSITAQPRKSVSNSGSKGKSLVSPHIEKPKAVINRKLSIEEQHKKKALDLKNHLNNTYYRLGIADIVSDLYMKGMYSSIFTLFKVAQNEYYTKQHSLDESSFRILWENAHQYVDVFIRGKKRVSSGPIVGYRKRSYTSHIADSGVWGRIASYGGTNGRLILINAGHGRR